ncbi:GNAT family N-acetyltransferase [Streptomyces sp. CMB-StM0423]|uniref:GNAT family N-acetyltransferase n=1 Tax=Streptomyces sp. CMB-StM0423 TaxID=2059884 RepID=UPI000C6FDAE8|nr:GNAT family N-acetyltransferase [Streptomyces sp. CMB-StM0423]AUH40122.1 siderophore biosynthesis protein [Streptomyces sp. CMB-StM0423]
MSPDPPTPTRPPELLPDDTIDFGVGLARLLRDAARSPVPYDINCWTPAGTPAGPFRLEPVDPTRPERDLTLLHRWMNDPSVAAFWKLAGPVEVTARHVRAQVEAGHSVPCFGVLDGVRMSYWEVYRADRDPLARYYRARPYDTGVHLLLGGGADRGRGLGSLLIRAVSDLVFDNAARCERVLAEPDVHNVPSVAAFLNAGFHFQEELALPDKRAALMVRERALRDSDSNGAGDSETGAGTAPPPAPPPSPPGPPRPGRP